MESGQGGERLWTRWPATSSTFLPGPSTASRIRATLRATSWSSALAKGCRRSTWTVLPDGGARSNPVGGAPIHLRPVSQLTPLSARPVSARISRSITRRTAANARFRMDRQGEGCGGDAGDVMGDSSITNAAPPETWPGRYGPCLMAGVRGHPVPFGRPGIMGWARADSAPPPEIRPDIGTCACACCAAGTALYAGLAKVTAGNAEADVPLDDSCAGLAVGLALDGARASPFGIPAVVPAYRAPVTPDAVVNPDRAALQHALNVCELHASRLPRRSNSSCHARVWWLAATPSAHSEP